MANIEVGSNGIAITTRSLSLERTACYLMSGALASGGLYGYMQRASLPSLLAGIGFGAFYGYSAVLIGRGGPRVVDGVDLSVLASAALLMAMGPRAYRTRATVPMALSAAGAMVLARMGYISYCLRHP